MSLHLQQKERLNHRKGSDLMFYGPGGFNQFDRTFNTMSSIVTIGFMLVFALIGFTIIKGILEWNKNNHSPRLTVNATVVTKRADVHHHHNNVNNMPHTTTSTTYYATFEVDSGDRIEFDITGHEYSMLVEGDQGELTFQGTRYIGFDRYR